MTDEYLSRNGSGTAIRTILRWALPSLALVLLGLGVLVYLDCKGLIDIFPKSEQTYICAVCGRQVVVRRLLGLELLGLELESYGQSQASSYCDRFVGRHPHILVPIAQEEGLYVFPLAHHDVPLADPFVLKALPTLEGTPYLMPVVRALSDVDNYHAYVARDVLIFETLGVLRPGYRPTRAKLDQWWEENRQCFEIEHDPEKALGRLKEIARKHRFANYGARQTFDLHEEYGVPTVGAKHKLHPQRQASTSP